MEAPDLHLLTNLGYIVLTAAVFAFLGKLIRMPSIVAYIFAGILLGPALQLVEMEHSLELLSELGIALLLFLVGLELSFDKVRDVGRVAIYAGIGQVLFTAFFGCLICLIIGYDWLSSIFLAVALTFSSTVVVVKLLDQKGDLNRLYGRIAVGIFLVQDIVVIVVLTVLTGLNTGAGDTLEWSGVIRGILMAGVGMFVLLSVVLLAARYLLPKPFSWAARSPDTIFIWALFWCFVIAGFAVLLGLSLEIGAFLAGIALAQLPYNNDLHRRLHPLMNFFVAVFFVLLGVEMDLSAALENWQSAILLSLFVLIGNPLIFMIIICQMGYSERTAFRTSVTVAQISEFSFIFAAMGVTGGLIGQEILSVVAVVGILTISLSAYMILYTEPLYDFCQRFGLLKLFRATAEQEKEESTERSNHIIIVGMNTLGRELLTRLCSIGETVVAVDTDPGKLIGLEPAETFIGNMEYESVVEEIGLRRAKLVISALQIEDTNHLLAYRCRAAEVPCAIHAFDMTLVDDLLELETGYLLTPALDGVVAQRNQMEKEGIFKS